MHVIMGKYQTEKWTYVTVVTTLVSCFIMGQISNNLIKHNA